MIARLRSVVLSWDGVLAILAVILIVVASVTTRGFASGNNFDDSLSQMSEKALMVLPLVVLIIAREIDISVASIAALSGIAMGMVVKSGGGLATGVVVAIIVGAVCGMINGVFVTVLGLPSLVVTLGTLALFRGLCFVVVGGQPISGLPDGLIQLGNGNIPGTYLPWVIVPFVVLAPLVAVVLHATPLGRRIFAIGGNPETAVYSGVRTSRIRFGMFVASGAISAVAGVIAAGRTSAAAPNGLLGFELDAITVVFLGGVSMLGGRGRMGGVIAALVVVVALRSMLQLQNAGGYAQSTAVGAILIGSLLAHNIALRTGASARRRRELSALDHGSPVSHPAGPSGATPPAT